MLVLSRTEKGNQMSEQMSEPQTWEAVASGNGEYVIVDDTDYDPETICTVHVPCPHATHTAAENAKMIEALPMLAEAAWRVILCKDVAHIYAGLDRGFGTETEVGIMWLEFREAAKKASGMA